MDEKKKVFVRPLVQLEGRTPQEVALELWFEMSEKEKGAFRRYVKKLQKVRGLDVLGVLELVVALSASNAV